MNQFIGRGNLAHSPQSKFIERRDGTGQTFVATMRVMFDRWTRDASGQRQKAGGFWREVQMYGNRAQEVVVHLRRGARVLVIGEEIAYEVTDAEGNKVQVYKIVAEDVALILARVESITFMPPRQRSGDESADSWDDTGAQPLPETDRSEGVIDA